MRTAVANHLNRAMRFLATRPNAPRLASLLRNQCNLLIAYSFACTPDLGANGEGWLLDRVAPHVLRFIDVGANRGEWSAAVFDRAPSAQGIAIDAGNAAVERLRARSLPRLEIIHAAVSDAGGQAIFYEQPDAGELSSLSDAHAAGARPEFVEVITLDDVIDDSGWDTVDLLKIDAEGWDYRCLLGAQRAIAAQKIALIQFEYSAPWLDAGSTLKAAITYLKLHGYEVRALRATSVVAYDYARLGEFFQYANFVAFVSESAGWLTTD